MIRFETQDGQWQGTLTFDAMISQTTDFDKLIRGIGDGSIVVKGDLDQLKDIMDLIAVLQFKKLIK